MPGTPTDIHVSRAEDGVDGKNPMNGFSAQDGPQRAVPHALLALVTEQQATNAHLAQIADSLGRIAAALDKPAAEEPPASEPKRRLWLPSRRNA
ncbi:hypothetical protein OIU91_06085 [Streptomyces sp. NBC_01456]|uniref:hypothetical protein n=1 Tax=unclassified Streptomyces TaxID=2593676 RepID=UPI002E33C1A1|nr:MULTISPECIES: hypothetical protein [unclassified Streptomyces]